MQPAGLGVEAGDVATLANLLINLQDPALAYDAYLRSKGITPDSELSDNMRSLQGFAANG